MTHTVSLTRCLLHLIIMGVLLFFATAFLVAVLWECVLSSLTLNFMTVLLIGTVLLLSTKGPVTETETDYNEDPRDDLQASPEPSEDPKEDQGKRRARLLKSIFKLVHERDVGQETTNPYIVVLRHFESGDELDLDTLNRVLAYHNVSITQAEFDFIKGLVPVPLPFPLPYNDPSVLSVLGPVTKVKEDMVTAVYVLTLEEDGRQYVGRSGNIASRLRAYTGAKAKRSMRTIDIVMTEKGASAFTLGVYLIPFAELEQFGPMTDAYRDKIILAMEQYYIMHLKSVLNDMLVVGGALTKYSSDDMVLVNASSAVGSKPLYVYNEDKTCLLYIDSSRLKFATDMGISYRVIWKSGIKGAPLLGKYFFMDEPIEGTTTALMTLEELRSAIKVLYLSNSGPKHGVTLTDLWSPDLTVLHFTSKAKALQHTVSLKRPVGKTFMAKLPCTHNGWLVEAVK